METTTRYKMIEKALQENGESFFDVLCHTLGSNGKLHRKVKNIYGLPLIDPFYVWTSKYVYGVSTDSRVARVVSAPRHPATIPCEMPVNYMS